MPLERSSPRRFESREERENTRFLLKVFDKGRDAEGYPDDVVMLHALSVETLGNAVRTGIIPGRSYATDLHGEGDLFAYPRVELLPTKRKPSKWLLRHIPPEEEPTFEDVVGYANIQAERHYMLLRFKVPYTEANLQVIDDLLRGETPSTENNPEVRARMIAFLQKYGEAEVGIHLAEARLRKGIIIGIKRTVLKKHPFGLGDPGHGDVKLMTADEERGTQGLSIKDIGYIRVLGPEGTVFFEDLRRRLE